VPTEAAARRSYGVARPLSRPTHGELHNHVRAHARYPVDVFRSSPQQHGSRWGAALDRVARGRCVRRSHARAVRTPARTEFAPAGPQQIERPHSSRGTPNRSSCRRTREPGPSTKASKSAREHAHHPSTHPAQERTPRADTTPPRSAIGLRRSSPASRSYVLAALRALHLDIGSETAPDQPRRAAAGKQRGGTTL
jgi:hypothetical protein